jgi:hypothetical protein
MIGAKSSRSWLAASAAIALGLPPLSDDQNGYRTADKDLGGLAAEQKTAQPASAVGGHDDKIAMSLVGGCDDRLGRL